MVGYFSGSTDAIQMPVDCLLPQVMKLSPAYSDNPKIDLHVKQAKHQNNMGPTGQLALTLTTKLKSHIRLRE